MIDNREFSEWAIEKYREIDSQLVIANADGEIDPNLINNALINFAHNFSWAITVQEVEDNKLSRLEQDYENWYHSCFSITFRALREEAAGAGRAPAQATVDARISQVYSKEKSEKLIVIANQKSRVELLKGFVKTLEKQASILQTLSSNMRSELFNSSGLSINGVNSQSRRTESAKAILRSSINGGSGVGQSQEAGI